MSLEILSCLTLSTAHVSAQTDNLLREEAFAQARLGGPRRLLRWVATYNYGWFLHTLDLGSVEEEQAMPADLLRVLQFAQDQGCELVRLDADGPVINDLPVFDWDINLET